MRGGRRRGRDCANLLTEAGRREEAARERRLLFLGGPLLFRVGRRHRHPRRWRAGVQDRRAEVAGKRRAQLRNAARQVAVVARQAREPVGRRSVVGVVKLGARRLPLRLQGEEQGGADPGRGDGAEACQHPAGKAHHRGSPRTQAHVLGWASGLRGSFGRRVGHDCGLPSVRTMRTFFWRSPPRRSSAAANSRSTIM